MFFVLVLMACLLGFGVRAYGCTTLVVGKDCSQTGSVMVAHNEDNLGRLFWSHNWIESRNDDGTLLRFEDGHAFLPRPAVSHGFFWASVRDERGHSASDRFVNDHGVVLVTNNCSFSRREHPVDLTEGGVWYALRRAVAERACSAYHGLLIATELVSKYGYGPSDRCYTIADAHEAWMLQIVSGKTFAAVRVGDDEVAIIPNHYTIRKGDLRRPCCVSPNLVENAVSRGWHQPCHLEDFDFAQAYQDPDSWKVPGNVYRHRCMARALGLDLDDDDPLPFAVQPKEKISAEFLWGQLSQHYEGTADGQCEQFGHHSPHLSPRRRICAETTHESDVYVLHPDPMKVVIQHCPGRPCTWPKVSATLEELKSHIPAYWNPLADPASALDRHCRPDGQYLNDGYSCHELWDQATALNLRWDELKDVHHQWLTETQRQLENVPLLEAEKIFDAKRAEFFGSQLVQPVELSFDQPSIHKGDRGEVEVSFVCDSSVDEASLRCGQSGTSPAYWASAVHGSCRKQGDRWHVRFRIRELTESARPCQAHFWLGGACDNGKWLAASGQLQVLDKKIDLLLGV